VGESLSAQFDWKIEPIGLKRSGGLLSYGNDPLDNCRRAASYADRILKGAKPNELPVQAPVKLAVPFFCL
jgi:ABC-type uncharacterized transport system substrate-binding protein